MTEVYDNYYIESPVPDSMTFIKALEFLSQIISPNIPLTFTGKGISIYLNSVQEKKKSVLGHVIRGLLIYNRDDLPDYQLYQEKDGSEQHRKFDKDCKLTFGIEGSVLTSCFGKNSLKATTNIKFFSKIGDHNMFYTKDKSKGEYTLKTIIGYSDPEASRTEVKIPLQGDKSFDFGFGSYGDRLLSPTVSMTVEEFNELCGGIKINENGTLKIVVHERGVKFTASDYGNPHNDFNQSIGILSKPIDTIIMDAKFFAKIHGRLDKFCYLKSIIHLYFGRTNGSIPRLNGNASSETSKNPVVSIVIQVGNSGHLVYQKQIIE